MSFGETSVAATWTPSDADEVAHALAASAELGAAVLPRGAGTQADCGNLPERADCFLSSAALETIDALDASEGVCHAGAGTPLARLQAAAVEAGWELPLEDAGRGSSLGGVLATARLTPRAQGFGRVRNVVLGLEIAHANGTVTRCGGRVVKNVTGYDLAKLYLGSLGSLGVLCGAWLRLRPKPQRVVRLESDPGTETASRAVDWARRASVRACAVREGATKAGAAIELAGDAASVAADRDALIAEGLQEAEDVDLFAHPAADGHLEFQLSFLPTRWPALAAHLRDLSVGYCAWPGLGVLSVQFDADAERAFALAGEAAAIAEGRWRCETPSLAGERDVFGATDAESALGRALKAQFDPAGVLNPGRMAGRL